MTKLTDLPGASEALPKLDSVPIKTIRKDNSSYETTYYDVSNLHLEVDVEAMAKIIIKLEDKFVSGRFGQIVDSRRFMAKELSASVLKWARLVRK